MSEAICVCGHGESEHTIFRTYYEDGKKFCHEFRPCLPWPDSEGWWWCDYGDFVDVVKAMKSKRTSDGVDVWGTKNHDEQPDEYETWMSEEDWYEYGYCHFVKVLEPNPFGEKP